MLDRLFATSAGLPELPRLLTKHAAIVQQARALTMAGNDRLAVRNDSGLALLTERSEHLLDLVQLAELRVGTPPHLPDNAAALQAAVMGAPIGLLILRGEDLIVELVNDTYLSIVDKTRERFVGKSLYESLPEVRAFVAPLFEDIFKTGNPYYGNEFEVTLHRLGKPETSFFNFVYYPLFNSHQAVDGVIVVATEVTDLVMSKFDLQEKEQKFRNIVTHSPIAMTIFRGPDFIIEMANNFLLEKIWRKKPEEVLGKKLLDVFPELLDQQFPELLRKVTSTGIAHREKEALAIVNSFDGSKGYYLDFEYAPLIEADGRVSGIMVTVNDVTEKVEARRRIEKAEKQYRELINTLPVAVYTTDAAGYVNIYNQAAVDLWRRTPSIGTDRWGGSIGMLSLTGQPIPREEFPTAIALRENRAVHMEGFIQRPDGSLRFVISNPQPIHDEAGATIGALNVLIDITERKKAESALKASEQQFISLTNLLPQFIWTANAEGNMNYFSQSFFDYTRIREHEVTTLIWLELLHPEDRQPSLDAWEISKRSGKIFQAEQRFRRFDGEYRWFSTKTTPQFDEQGKIRQWVGTATDIHDSKLLSDDLTSQIIERNKDLKLINERLLRSNSELLQFAYVASHDLQEPLRKIQTFVSRISYSESELLTAKGKDYLQRIENASHRTQQLIKDLLAYSRANATDHHFVSTNLADLVAKVIGHLQENIEEKHATVQVAPLPVLPVIPFQAEQLFTNLLVNALKFTVAGRKPEIRINMQLMGGEATGIPEADRSSMYYHISVADNGIGFDPQFRDKIFLVFQRLHGKESYEGTGIGLAICKKIVENHNGFITADASPNKGATFHIFLPG